MRTTKKIQYIMLPMVLLIGLEIVSALSDKRLCANPECNKIISTGSARMNYNAAAPGMVSFRIRSPIRIFSKEAGSDSSLWGIEVNGRRGYAPKGHIMEEKVFVKRQDLIEVATNVEVKEKEENTTLKPSELNIEDSKPTTPLETIPPVVESIPKSPEDSITNVTPVQIIDGTSIPFNDNIPTTTTISLQEKEEKSSVKEDTKLKVKKLKEEDNKTVVSAIEAAEPNDQTGREELDKKTDVEVINNNATEVEMKTEVNISNSEQVKVAEEVTEATTVPPTTEPGLIYSYLHSFVEAEHTTTSKPMIKETTKTVKLDGKGPQEKYEQLKEFKQEIPREKKEENMEEAKEIVKNESKEEVNAQAKEEPLNVAKEEVIVQAKEELKEQAKDEVKNEAKEEVNAQAKEEPLNVAKEEVKVQAKEELKEQVKEEVKNEAKEEVNAQAKGEPLNVAEEEVIVQAKEELKEQAKEEVKNEAKEEVNAQAKEEPLNVAKEEVKVQAKEELKEHVKEEVKEQGDDVVKVQSKDEVNKQDEREGKPQTEEEVQELPMDVSKNVLIDGPANETVEKQANKVEAEQPEIQKVEEANIDLSQDLKHQAAEVKNDEKLVPEIVQLATLPQENDKNKSQDTLKIQEQEEKEDKNDNKIPTETSKVMNEDDKDQENKSQNLVLSNAEVPEKISAKTEQVNPIDLAAPNVKEEVRAFAETKSRHFEEQTVPEDANNVENKEININNELNVQQMTNPEVPSEQINPTTENSVNQESETTTQSYATIDPNEFYKNLQEQTQKPWEQVAPTILPNVQEKQSDEIYQTSTESDKTVSESFLKEKQPEFNNNEYQPAAEINDHLALDSQTPSIVEKMEHEGLFGKILGTVNSFWSSEKKENAEENDELHSILYPNTLHAEMYKNDDSAQYCQKELACECKEWKDMSMDKFLEKAADKVLELSDLLACLVIAGITSLLFLFGYNCFCSSSREGALIAKLNHLERSLLAGQQENAILKDELIQTRQKLSGIEDHSFGSNDMVIALKTELEGVQQEKAKLQQQVHTLEKELENAAEAGLELNKIVSDLLSNQTGDESIISSVEELQKQLNEQQNTILEINANLAEKSRENSELQLMLAEQGARLNGEIASLQQDNDELEAEKSNLQTRLEEMKNEFDEDITKALEGKNFEIKRLQNEIVELQRKCEVEHTKWQTSMAKVEALEECLKTVKKDPSVNISEVINVANVRAEVLDMQKKCASFKERLDVELEAKRLLENKLKSCTEEIEKLKVDFHQSEKDKLEAQTRLEVLSNYFKEKETQLQKELSVKEAMWLKQQGETTSTVDRLTAMQEEINSLKSQNDSLRAEIEAQLAAHKAQTGTLENRAHETWLAARQSERRYEEARAEASALRRKLTALVGGNLTDAQRVVNDGKVPNDAPSPIHMESPGSPLLGRLPPPGFLPPPPFLGPPPPFMGMPPPPFVPSGEMRPAPLGRITPPPRMGYSSGKYNDYDVEYDDDDDDYDDDENDSRHQRRRRYSRDSDDWSRHRSPYKSML